MIELKDWKGDDLHIDSEIGKMDGHGKTWNFIISEREAGKSCLLWKKVYNAFRREGKPSIIMRRFQSDINEAYIDSIEYIINKFTNSGVKFEYKKTEMKQGGQMDLRLNDKVFCRLVGLNTPLSRLKQSILPNVKYFMNDEFICSRRRGERYLNDEAFVVKELYTTYRREADPAPKIYMFGNPYSKYTPYFIDKHVETNKLAPGKLLAENDWCVWLYTIKPELKEKILKENPLYEFDDSYRRYAAFGESIEDDNIRIEKEQPKNFRLEYVLKLKGQCIGVYHGYRFGDDKLFYWTKFIDEGTVSKRRDIVCFDFGDMADRTVLNANGGKKLYSALRESIEHRWIAFASIQEGNMIEEIYQLM